MSKNSVGLDIGVSTIKVVALERNNEQTRLVSLGSIPCPQSGLMSDSEVGLQAVADAIKKLFAATHIDEKDVVVALPESKVFTRIIDDLPYLTDNDLSSAIRYAAEEFIPMPIADVNLNWQVLFRSDGKVKQEKSAAPATGGDHKNNRTIVMVVASPKNIVDKYMKVLNMAGLHPRVLETEIIAVSRSLVGNNPFSPSTLIVQLGATTTDFAAISKGLIWLTRSISTGGMALTRSLSQYFNFELAQSEEYKKVYGLMEDQLEGKVYEALKPVVDIISGEGRRVVQSFEIKYPNDPIKRVVLSGGGAKMPGFVIFLANTFGLEVQEADPWYAISKDKSSVSRLAADAPSYSVAVGLALRED